MLPCLALFAWTGLGGSLPGANGEDSRVLKTEEALAGKRGLRRAPSRPQQDFNRAQRTQGRVPSTELRRFREFRV